MTLLWAVSEIRRVIGDNGKAMLSELPGVVEAKLAALRSENERLKAALEHIAEMAERPAYNSLEVGFRHTRLTDMEILNRHKDTCKFIEADARSALNPQPKAE